MWEKIQTALLVTFVAILIWLYAYAETVKSEEIEVDVMLVPETNREFIIAPSVAEQVKLKIRGNAIQLGRVKSENFARLSLPIEDDPENPVRKQIDLLPLLREHDIVQSVGITIESVTPASMTNVRVERYETRELPIEVRIPENATYNEPAVDVATVKLPASLADQLDGEKLIAEANVEDMTPGVPSTRDVPLQLPESVRGKPYISVTPDRLSLQVTVQKSQVQATLPVPIFLVVPPSALNDYIPRLESGSSIIQVKLAGPKQTITDLQEKPELRLTLRAELVLTVDELAQGVGKQVTAQVVISKPPNVEVVEPPDVVTYTVERFARPGDGAGVLP